MFKFNEAPWTCKTMLPISAANQWTIKYFEQSAYYTLLQAMDSDVQSMKIHVFNLSKHILQAYMVSVVGIKN